MYNYIYIHVYIHIYDIPCMQYCVDLYCCIPVIHTYTHITQWVGPIKELVWLIKNRRWISGLESFPPGTWSSLCSPHLKSSSFSSNELQPRIIGSINPEKWHNSPFLYRYRVIAHFSQWFTQQETHRKSTIIIELDGRICRKPLYLV